MIQLTLHTSPSLHHGCYSLLAICQRIFDMECHSNIWTADCEPHILSDAIEQVYIAFFCSNSALQLWNLLEEVLFSHFMTTLNDTFEKELTQEDRGYESRSESQSIPTSLRRALQIYHISTSENLSCDPTTPLTTAEQHPEYSPQRFRSCKPVCHHLMFTSSDNESPVRTSDPHLGHHSTQDNNPFQGRAEPPSQLHHHMDYHPHLHQAQMTPSRMLQQKKRIFPQIH